MSPDAVRPSYRSFVWLRTESARSGPAHLTAVDSLRQCRATWLIATALLHEESKSKHRAAPFARRNSARYRSERTHPILPLVITGIPMRITSIRIHNFKRFTDLHITDIPSAAKLIVVVGPNGCGKSSLFDAFLNWWRWRLRQHIIRDDDYFLKNAAAAADDRQCNTDSR